MMLEIEDRLSKMLDEIISNRQLERSEDDAQ